MKVKEMKMINGIGFVSFGKKVVKRIEKRITSNERHKS